MTDLDPPMQPTQDQLTERVIFRRLGQTQARVFHIRISDPVKVDILSASVQVEEVE